MIFTETELKGAYVVEPERLSDDRGFFAYAFQRDEFAARGLTEEFVECYISFNRRAGTLRGMHYQKEPHGQAKLVRCTRGAIFDVGIDLRPDSSTFGRWIGLELSAENRRQLYLPVGFAHGYLTLEDSTEIFYQSSSRYAPQASAGVRWDDPAFGVKWPRTDGLVMNERDRTYPDFNLREGR
jgi:dTDP-4-dehydrorhamnose 3,5-epimerase